MKRFSLISRRWLSHGFKDSNEIPEELRPFTEGRGRQERLDSLTLQILNERKLQSQRIQSFPLDIDALETLEQEGFGRKKRLPGFYQGTSEVYEDFGTSTGAGGKAHLLGSFNLELPLFDHLLPEIAMLGHSNAGKSTFVNALIGVLPRSGPARVSDRAGWTNHLYYYRLGKKPPVMTLVDFPGYGFAVAHEHQKTTWRKMTFNYLKHRMVMTKCCILVDSQRGLCREDRQLIKYASKLKLPWIIVLTKADLLSSEDMMRTIHYVKKELLPYQLPHIQVGDRTFGELFENQECRKYLRYNYGHLDEIIWPVSASTGAGITKFWKALNSWVDKDAVPFVGETNVREHKLAGKMRYSYSQHHVRAALDPMKQTIKVSNRELKQLKK